MEDNVFSFFTCKKCSFSLIKFFEKFTVEANLAYFKGKK